MASDPTAPPVTVEAAPKKGLLGLIGDAFGDAANLLETAGATELAKKLKLRGIANAASVVDTKIDEAKAAKAAFDQSAIPVAARAVKSALDDRKRKVAEERAKDPKRTVLHRGGRK